MTFLSTTAAFHFGENSSNKIHQVYGECHQVSVKQKITFNRWYGKCPNMYVYPYHTLDLRPILRSRNHNFTGKNFDIISFNPIKKFKNTFQ